MRQIPRFIAPMNFGDVRRALRSRGDEEPDALRRFAGRFAAYIGVRHAIPAPSGRMALLGILTGLGLKPGGEVILPALTFHSVPAMVRHAGLAPVFVDVGPSTYCIDPARIERAVTPSTVAILPTHLYGRACELDVVSDVAARHGLAVIEDCAQACGARYRDRRLGSLGTAAFFSYGSTKNLSVLGAAMVVTDSPELAARVSEWMGRLPRVSAVETARRILFALGMRAASRPLVWATVLAPALRLLSRFGVDPIEALTSESPGGSADSGEGPRAMPGAFQGRIGLGQLERLDESNFRRIRNGEHLRERLAGLPGCRIPAAAPESENIYMSFPVQVPDRARFRARLRRNGVDTATGYMSAGPALPGFSGGPEDASAAVEAVAHMVHLPVYPELTAGDVDQIAEAVSAALRE